MCHARCGTDTVLGDRLRRCDDFMEWNARVQLTTWHPVDSPTNPTPSENTPWPGAINDYARKQWAGLVGDYYAARVEQYLEQEGLADANRKTRFNTSEVTQREARLAFDFQTNFGNVGQTQPSGDPVAVSSTLRSKYSSYFASCASQ